MVELMPFGKNYGKSVEQILTSDFDYFKWVMPKVSKRSTRDRMEYILHVSDNFKSKIMCPTCNENLVDKISFYHGYRGSVTSSPGYTYCSFDCFEHGHFADPGKTNLYDLGLSSIPRGLSKQLTKGLSDVIFKTMGLEYKRKSKEYLADFFDKCELRI